MLVYPMLPVMQTSSRRRKSTEETGTERLINYRFYYLFYRYRAN